MLNTLLLNRRKYHVKTPVGAVPTQADAEEYYPTPQQGGGVCYPAPKGGFPSSSSSYYPAPHREYIPAPQGSRTKGPDIIPNQIQKGKDFL